MEWLWPCCTQGYFGVMQCTCDFSEYKISKHPTSSTNCNRNLPYMYLSWITTVYVLNGPHKIHFGLFKFRVSELEFFVLLLFFSKKRGKKNIIFDLVVFNVISGSFNFQSGASTLMILISTKRFVGAPCASPDKKIVFGIFKAVLLHLWFLFRPNVF